MFQSVKGEGQLGVGGVVIHDPDIRGEADMQRMDGVGKQKSFISEETLNRPLDFKCINIKMNETSRPAGSQLLARHVYLKT